MLILSRKVGEAIVIGQDAEVEIVVSEIRGDKVRLGVEAPKNIPVNRKEVSEIVLREGRSHIRTLTSCEAAVEFFAERESLDEKLTQISLATTDAESVAILAVSIFNLGWTAEPKILVETAQFIRKNYNRIKEKVGSR